MSLVDAETGEIVEQSTPDEARARADRIQVAVGATWELIREAYLKRDWSALGYSSWDDYCTREFGASRLRLPREERQETVASLRESGLSTRAIAAATGVDQKTVRNDLAAGEEKSSPGPSDAPAPSEAVEPDEERGPGDDSSVDPAPSDAAEKARDAYSALGRSLGQRKPVQGTDGKTYSPKAKPSEPKRKPLTDAAEKAGWEFRRAVERLERITTDDRFAANKEQVAAHLRGHLTYAVEVITDLLDDFDHQSQED